MGRTKLTKAKNLKPIRQRATLKPPSYFFFLVSTRAKPGRKCALEKKNIFERFANENCFCSKKQTQTALAASESVHVQRQCPSQKFTLLLQSNYFCTSMHGRHAYLATLGRRKHFTHTDIDICMYV